MFFVDWWNSLELALQIFYCIAIPSSLALLIQTAMIFLGGDHGGEDASDGDLPDGDLSEEGVDGLFGKEELAPPVDVEGFDSLHILTVKGVISFFVVFGWTGVAMLASGQQIPLTLGVSAAGGFLMMIAVAYLMRAVMRLRSSGTSDNRNALGVAGRVYLTVPASRSGEGKVNIMLQGTYCERQAVTDETEPIPTGCEIVVVGLSGQTDLVVRRK